MEEHFQTRPPDSFFKARDLYDTALYYGDLKLTRAEGAVFRYLLENAWYRTQDPRRYGYVVEDALGTASIGAMCCMAEKPARIALAGLEAKGMIERHQRRVTSGGRKPDEIRVRWLTEGTPKRSK